MQFKVIDPADYSDPDPADWSDVEACTPGEAAEVFCERSDRDNRYEYSTAETAQVLVKNDKEQTFLVHVLAQITHLYYATKVEQK